MSASIVGVLLGFAFGVVWVTLGFGPAVLCGLLAFVGWFIGGVLQGKIVLTDLWQMLQGQRRAQP